MFLLILFIVTFKLNFLKEKKWISELDRLRLMTLTYSAVQREYKDQKLALCCNF